MKTYKIAVIAGDGIGPEVVREGLKVLKASAKKNAFTVEPVAIDIGANRYLRTGEILPESCLQEMKGCDAIFLGAIGHPDVKPGILEQGILLKLRFFFDQYINLRPVHLYENVETPLKDKKPEDIDYTVIRENTGDVYTGIGGVSLKGTPQEVAMQVMVYNRHQVERCVRYAFQYARQAHQASPWRGLTVEDRQKGYIGKLTLCGKTNVLTYVYDLWQRTVDEVAAEFPDIKTDYVHVDAMCIFMIENPQRFDVIVTGNMFGDIITDLAAVTQGGMGVAPSGNIHPEGLSMFEPIHGSAPQFAGQGVVNPIAAISAASLMLRHLGEFTAASQIDLAVCKTITRMKSMLVGQMGYSTAQVGDFVAQAL